MAESSGATSPNQKKTKDENSSRSKLRDFVTSTAGLVTGLATIVTATATIVGVLWHGSSQAPPEKSHSGAQSPSSQATDSAVHAAPEKARVQWGPGDLLLTNNGTSLSTVPPGNIQGFIGDVYTGYSTVSPFAGTTLVLWTDNGQPTAQQCQYLATTQGNPGQTVNVVPGSVVCAVTAEGPIAIIHVISVDMANATIETRTTVWDLPGS